VLCAIHSASVTVLSLQHRAQWRHDGGEVSTVLRCVDHFEAVTQLERSTQAISNSWGVCCQSRRAVSACCGRHGARARSAVCVSNGARTQFGVCYALRSVIRSAVLQEGVVEC